mmetsp:Transcript_26675/g.58171  ORF Transcript_26675/g.58171 Transcript_26675/m.58171 type:complete len:149 (+) Transcript_26675:295-741(+)
MHQCKFELLIVANAKERSSACNSCLMQDISVAMRQACIRNTAATLCPALSCPPITHLHYTTPHHPAGAPPCLLSITLVTHSASTRWEYQQATWGLPKAMEPAPPPAAAAAVPGAVSALWRPHQRHHAIAADPAPCAAASPQKTPWYCC